MRWRFRGADRSAPRCARPGERSPAPPLPPRCGSSGCAGPPPARRRRSDRSAREARAGLRRRRAGAGRGPFPKPSPRRRGAAAAASPPHIPPIGCARGPPWVYVPESAADSLLLEEEPEDEREIEEQLCAARREPDARPELHSHAHGGLLEEHLGAEGDAAAEIEIPVAWIVEPAGAAGAAERAQEWPGADVHVEVELAGFHGPAERPDPVAAEADPRSVGEGGVQVPGLRTAEVMLERQAERVAEREPEAPAWPVIDGFQAFAGGRPASWRSG